jgi:hypothetical protein
MQVSGFLFYNKSIKMSNNPDRDKIYFLNNNAFNQFISLIYGE